MKKQIKALIVLLILVSLSVNIVSCTNVNSSDDSTDINTGIPVLTYHRVVTHEIKVKHFPNNKWVNDLDNLKDNMKYLHDNGYKTLSMDEFYSWYIGEAEYDIDKTVVITFDDGDIENYYNVMPVLREYNFSATVFVVGERTQKSGLGNPGVKPEYMSHELIQKMKSEYPKFEVQSHTYGMHRQIDGDYAIRKADSAALNNDFCKMYNAGYRYIAYPYGVKTDISTQVFSSTRFKLGFGFGQPDLPYRRAKRTDAPDYIARINVDATNEKNANFKQLLA